MSNNINRNQSSRSPSSYHKQLHHNQDHNHNIKTCFFSLFLSTPSRMPVSANQGQIATCWAKLSLWWWLMTVIMVFARFMWMRKIMMMIMVASRKLGTPWWSSMMMSNLDASLANHFLIPKRPRQCDHSMLGDLVRDAGKGQRGYSPIWLKDFNKKFRKCNHRLSFTKLPEGEFIC